MSHRKMRAHTHRRRDEQQYAASFHVIYLSTRRDLTATHHPRMMEQEVKRRGEGGKGKKKGDRKPKKRRVRSSTTSRIVDITET
jgi:hypothetical protein